ncbi:hypothetical protein JCM11491_004209 [Sporobolomyces phaffii]
MVRSPGLTNSSFSDSTRSFSPYLSPVPLASPVVAGHLWGAPTMDQLQSLELKEEDDAPDSTDAAILGLAGLSFYEPEPPAGISQSLPSDRRTYCGSFYVHPDHHLGQVGAVEPNEIFQLNPLSHRDGLALPSPSFSRFTAFPSQYPSANILNHAGSTRRSPHHTESSQRSSAIKSKRSKRHTQSLPAPLGGLSTGLEASATTTHRPGVDPRDSSIRARSAISSRSTPTFHPYSPIEGHPASPSSSARGRLRTRSFERNPALSLSPFRDAFVSDSASPFSFIFRPRDNLWYRDTLSPQTQRPTSFVRESSSANAPSPHLPNPPQ